MTHGQAHQILDRLKDGFVYPTRLVDKALWLTGDLDAHEAMRSEGMGQTLSSESLDGWGASSESMVALDDWRHRTNPRLRSGNRA